MTAMYARNVGRPAAGALAVLLAAALSGAGAANAAAADGNTTVELPVLKSKLTANDDCTRGSGRPATAVPWEQVSLQLGRAWQFASGSGIKVGVVDTGVSASAPALKGRVVAVGEAGSDCVGHGTFVAGLIAAQLNRGVKFAGVARQSAIVAARGTDQRGTVTAEKVAAGIKAAVGAGAEVVTVSAAFPGDSAALRSAVRLAAKRDVLLIAAAVPDSPTGGVGQEIPARNYYPAASDGVLSVLDVDVAGKRPAGSYTTGSAQLAAPGDGVVGIGPSKEGHYIGSGASLAAGFVAGAAALVRSVHPELTAAQTADLLRSSAYPDAVPRVDPYAAVTTVLPSASTAAEAPAGPEAAGPVQMPQDKAAGPLRRAMWPALAGVAVTITVVWLSLIIPRGRRTGWRPSRRP
ncbi:S8 family serine peptidase [Streptomyces sp. ITFR-16]|uniref:S8 family serine peptidase n=1 Tax=Streptomyces sp. ITFR-16 TaxID=3075198 RepID=UPI002889A849|nr:S8 family serine peptidase [Streptomyces sp. ITFR-16]WNI21443.1 S8 family serine peptidase [Streptomyces sp. ITFR-16]